MSVNLYYTQKVRGFQQENIKYSKGFRNREYFKSKIYQLPEISSEKSI